MNYLPYNKNLVSRAKELRQNMTLAEKKIWYDYLRDFKYRVHKQRPIDNFTVDFYCPKLKLVIEIDADRSLRRKCSKIRPRKNGNLTRLWFKSHKI